MQAKCNCCTASNKQQPMAADFNQSQAESPEGGLDVRVPGRSISSQHCCPDCVDADANLASTATFQHNCTLETSSWVVLGGICSEAGSSITSPAVTK